ncbi:hypothetical protein N9W12_08180, partial [Luminiphilus sp.]|nr:hypothetical protein [Luminiphilus sp.]
MYISTSGGRFKSDHDTLTLDKRRHARTDKAGQKEQKVVVFWERLGFGQKTGLVAAAGVFVAGQIALNLTLA